MSIFKSLHDAPDWAAALIFIVGISLIVLVFVLVIIYGPRPGDSDLRSGSGGERTGQDAGTNRENREEDIFCRLILSKSDQDDN